MSKIEAFSIHIYLIYPKKLIKLCWCSITEAIKYTFVKQNAKMIRTNDKEKLSNYLHKNQLNESGAEKFMNKTMFNPGWEVLKNANTFIIKSCLISIS